MSKATRTILSVVVSLMLVSALTMAQTGAKNSDKDKNKEHPSRFAKVAFWRHHDKSAKKPAQAAQAPSTQPQVKTAQLKPAVAKQTAGNNSQKQQHASQMSKPSAKKAPGTNKTKAQPKAHDPKADSL